MIKQNLSDIAYEFDTVGDMSEVVERYWVR